jgi:hypothetical protein
MAVLAAIGLGVQALSGVGSFIQAGQRQKEIDKANAAAQKAVAEAKKQIQLKPFEALTVSDTPYERQREMFASQAAQATQAAAEMGAAGMGRVGAIAMAGDEAQAEVRDQQIQQLEAIEQLKAKDEARASQQLASLSLQEAEGAQLAARDAQTAKTAAITSGLGAITGIGQQMASVNPVTGEAMFELYGKDKSKTKSSTAGRRTLSASQQPRNIMIGDQGLDTSSVVSQAGTVVDPSALGYNQYSMGSLFGGAGTFENLNY